MSEMGIHRTADGLFAVLQTIRLFGNDECHRDFPTNQVETLKREAYGTAHFIAIGSSAEGKRVAEEEINDHPPDRFTLRCGLLGVLQSARSTSQPVTRLGN